MSDEEKTVKQPKHAAPEPEAQPQPKHAAPEPEAQPKPKHAAPEPEAQPQPKHAAPEPEAQPTQALPEPGPAAEAAPAELPKKEKSAKASDTAPKKKKPAKKGQTRSVRTSRPEPHEEKKKKKSEPEEELDPREAERAYKPIRSRRDGRIGCMGGIMYALFIMCTSILLAVFGWMAASDVLALNKTAESVEITLPESAFTKKTVDVTDDDGNVTGTKSVRCADMNTVAGILKDYGLINYKWLFRLYSSFSNADRQISPGTYELTTNLDYRALVKKMQAGADSQLQTLVMFPEGYNLDQVFAKLEENGVCSAEDLYEAAANAEYSYAFLEGVETGDPYRLEGFLFPDTYYFYQGMQASSAINKFLSNLHYRITDEMWQQASALNLTFRQVITVASLIEREAANDEERATIASVIYNRLNAGMPLQLDSTVVYALRETGETTMSIDLIMSTDSPYNTYLYQGLPPGPICNPGMNSIEAALNPEQTNYYYFALDMETKSMRFFETLEEHEAFVATQDYG